MKEVGEIETYFKYPGPLPLWVPGARTSFYETCGSYPLPLQGLANPDGPLPGILASFILVCTCMGAGVVENENEASALY